MTRTILAACLAAVLAGPALAEPMPDCSGLLAARAQARAAAAPLDYQVFDMDGGNAHVFQQEQGVTRIGQADHLTVMVNPRTGRAVALLNDAPKCAFGSVVSILKPDAPPMDSALDFLRLAR